MGQSDPERRQDFVRTYDMTNYENKHESMGDFKNYQTERREHVESNYSNTRRLVDSDFLITKCN